MKLLFTCANTYVQNRDWKMLEGLKFCLCAIGVILGLLVPEKHKQKAGIAAGLVFLLTYIPLMTDFITFSHHFLTKKTGKTE